MVEYLTPFSKPLYLFDHGIHEFPKAFLFLVFAYIHNSISFDFCNFQIVFLFLKQKITQIILIFSVCDSILCYKCTSRDTRIFFLLKCNQNVQLG